MEENPGKNCYYCQEGPLKCPLKPEGLSLKSEPFGFPAR